MAFLLDPKRADIQAKKRIASTTSHEVAHQWRRPREAATYVGPNLAYLRAPKWPYPYPQLAYLTAPEAPPDPDLAYLRPGFDQVLLLPMGGLSIQ